MHSEDTVRIPLRARDGRVRAYALVDTADAAWVNQWTWRLGGKGYAVRSEGWQRSFRMIYLHRELLGLAFGDTRQGDHINMEKLDNRRTNLRIVTKAQQQQNQPGHRNASSRYRGVSWDTRVGKWHAFVRPNRKMVHLGFFDDELEAAEAARSARVRLLPFATT
jgi:hypothetical protein